MSEKASMDHERCTVCEHSGKIRVGESLDLVYQEGGRQIMIPLCWSHSVELFKSGQTFFINKYEDSFENYKLDSQAIYYQFRTNNRQSGY